MRARIDAATLLQRALIGDAAAVGIAIEIGTATATRWASATFVGARHRLTVIGPRDIGPRDAAAAAWLGRLAEADLPIRGHLVADLIVVAEAHCDGRFEATVEVLTVKEG